MLIVHHLGISQSDRIVWLCEELGLEYELRRYARDPVSRMAPPEYKALHPFGTAPVIEDDGTVLGESGAIVAYLLARAGGTRLSVAPGAPNFADYLYWFHFANGSMVPAGMVDLVVSMLAPESGARLALLRARGDLAFAMVERRLTASDYLAGPEFTAADLMMAFPLTTMRLFVPRDLGPYPAIRAYLQRLAARAAFRRAMAKADPGFSVPIS